VNLVFSVSHLQEIYSICHPGSEAHIFVLHQYRSLSRCRKYQLNDLYQGLEDLITTKPYGRTRKQHVKALCDCRSPQCFLCLSSLSVLPCVSSPVSLCVHACTSQQGRGYWAHLLLITHQALYKLYCSTLDVVTCWC